MKKYKTKKNRLELINLLQNYNKAEYPNIDVKVNTIKINMGRIIANFKYKIDENGIIYVKYQLGILGIIKIIFFISLDIFILFLLNITIKSLFLIMIILLLEFLPIYFFEYKISIKYIEKFLEKI